MTMFASADLLAEFDFYTMRPGTDESYSTAQKYRILSLAQREVFTDLCALFPRLLMGAPELMVTTDSGATYTISGTNVDAGAIMPFGSAEVYGSATGRELYGSTYSGKEGDVVFEGAKIRMPAGGTRTFDTGPYIRYSAMPGVLDASTEPVLPSEVRGLIVPVALMKFANRGGLRDSTWARELYADVWAGPSRQGGLLAALTKQYRHSADGSQAGVAWWRARMSAGLAIAMT